MHYRPEVDGLRAVAVLPVILFHAGLDVFSGGFVGVDVFFVISGFLITTIIVSRIEGPGFSLLDFYARRVRRILPALAVIIVATTPFAWLWMLPTEFKDYAQSIAAVSIFSSNFLFWIESGYFAAAAENKPLLHTWSLAVEEQYYLFFPLLLMAFWKRSRAFSIALLSFILLGSLATSEALWRTAPDANFYLLPSRAWELMVGSLSAIFVLKKGQQSNAAISAIGLALIVFSIFYFDDHTPFPSLWALIPVIGTAFVLVYGTTGTPVAKLLSLRIPVFVGLISYSAYLWHQPLLALARLRDPLTPHPLLMLGLGLLSLPLAYCSWRFVEQPARHGRAAAWRVVAAAGAASAAFCVIGAGLSVSDAQERYFRATISPQNQPLLAHITEMQTISHEPADDGISCRFIAGTYDSAFRQRFGACHEAHGDALVVFGDSHSTDVFNGLVSALDEPFILGFEQGQCRPHIAGSDCETLDLPRFLEGEADRIGVALYVQAGFWLFTDSEGRALARTLFAAGTEVDAILNDAAIDRAIDVLSRFDTWVPVVWFGPRIEPHVQNDTMLSIECDRAPEALTLRTEHEAAFRSLDMALRERASEAGLGYVSEQELMSFDIGADLYDCNELYWSDVDHWSPKGEEVFGTRIAPGLMDQLQTLLPDFG